MIILCLMLYLQCCTDSDGGDEDSIELVSH